MSGKNDELAKRLADAYGRYIGLYSRYSIANTCCYIGLALLLVVALLCMFLRIFGAISNTACVVWLIVMGILLILDALACRVTGKRFVFYQARANMCANDLAKLYGQEAADVVVLEAEALLDEKRERRKRAVRFHAESLGGSSVNIVVAPEGGVRICNSKSDGDEKSGGIFNKNCGEKVENTVETVENVEDDENMVKMPEGSKDRSDVV